MGQNSFTPRRMDKSGNHTPRSGKNDAMTNLVISHSMNRIENRKLGPQRGSSGTKKRYRRSLSHGTGIGGNKKVKKSITQNHLNYSPNKSTNIA
jgi:hypothetical protein